LIPVTGEFQIHHDSRPVASLVCQGVVEDLKHSKLDANPETEYYVPYRYVPMVPDIDPGSRRRNLLGVAPLLCTLVSYIDKSQPVADITTL
jgi:hypothetical protein